ncbi:hypothetical protein [Pseudomonas sp. UMAB-40]|uniref:hypothetical protein n=1 Tax=Pseudomonas sp. UMAB-40 TaxID=1365407 RepID=UPI001C55FBBC|nr:hypothetical protein [Pseudomonas sp. UMAB-40]
MKVQITQTLTRTIVIDVPDTNEKEAIDSAVNSLADYDAGDWDCTFEPVSQEANVVHN